MLALIALNSAIYSFLRCLPVRDRIEPRRLTRASSAAPVNHVAVMPSISMQRQRVVREESPALSVGGHDDKLIWQGLDFASCCCKSLRVMTML